MRSKQFLFGIMGLLLAGVFVFMLFSEEEGKGITPLIEYTITPQETGVDVEKEETEVATSTETVLVEETVTIPTPAPIIAAKKATPEPEVVRAQETDARVMNEAKMLSLHNKFRSEDNVPALTWSDAVAKTAQVWSDTLAKENCTMRHDPDTPYGENLFWSWRTGENSDGLISSETDAATWWANEKEFYDYDDNSCNPSEQCGHYTQMVWENTTEVGCGVSSCVEGTKQTDMWVCRYNPPGNDGSRPF